MYGVIEMQRVRRPIPTNRLQPRLQPTAYRLSSVPTYSLQPTAYSPERREMQRVRRPASTTEKKEISR